MAAEPGSRSSRQSAYRILFIIALASAAHGRRQAVPAVEQGRHPGIVYLRVGDELLGLGESTRGAPSAISASVRERGVDPQPAAAIGFHRHLTG